MRNDNNSPTGRTQRYVPYMDIILIADLHMWGQHGLVYSPLGVSPTILATCHKNPLKVVTTYEITYQKAHAT